MSNIDIPRRRRIDFVRQYTAVEMTSPQEISIGEARGLFILRVVNGNHATNPDIWEIKVEGGYEYRGDYSKYFFDPRMAFNVVSVTDTTPPQGIKGFNYELEDVFGRTFEFKFQPGPNQPSTIRQIAGPALSDPVEIRTILFL